MSQDYRPSWLAYCPEVIRIVGAQAAQGEIANWVIPPSGDNATSHAATVVIPTADGRIDEGLDRAGVDQGGSLS